MSQIGSFALLLGLALSAYSFLAGALALARPGPGSERLGETARRAGIATFALVFLAAVVLVTSAFQDAFSIAYIYHHSNRDLPAPYKFATLWSGQEGSLLFWSLLLAAYGLVLRLRHKTDTRLFAYASVVIAAVQIFFLLLLNFAAHPFALMTGTLPADGAGLNPLLQYPEMVIHPPLDHGDMGLPDLWRFPRRALGVFSFGLGRLLGMGSGRERLAHAMADRHRVPAFRNDAGKTGHAKDVEYVADLRHVLAGDSGDVPHPQRNHQFGACFRTVFDRRLVQVVSVGHFGRVCVFLFQEQIAPAQ